MDTEARTPTGKADLGIAVRDFKPPRDRFRIRRGTAPLYPAKMRAEILTRSGNWQTRPAAMARASGNRKTPKEKGPVVADRAVEVLGEDA